MPQNTATLVVWVSNQDRIASFHYVEGYQQMDFTRQDFFAGYLQSLVGQGYHFM